MAEEKKIKNLEIDLNNIQGWVEGFCSEKDYDLKEIHKGGNEQVIIFTFELSESSFSINFYPTKGNRYTLFWGTGKNQDISKEFAEYIIDRLGTVNTTEASNSFSVKLEEKTFLAFIDLLCEEDVNCTKNENDKEYLYRLKSSKYGDNITIHYFKNTNRLQVQGRRLQLFNKAVDLVSMECETTEIVAAEIRYAKVSLEVDDIMNEMEKALGDVYLFLAKAHKDILCSAFVQYRVEIPMPDYSMIVQASARGMEGYMLKILSNNNVIVDDNSIGYFFTNEDHNRPLSLKSEYESAIDNNTITSELNRLYKWWHKTRHQYSHARENDWLTATISDRRVADSLFKEAIELIKSSYDRIKAAK